MLCTDFSRGSFQVEITHCHFVLIGSAFWMCRWYTAFLHVPVWAYFPHGLKILRMYCRIGWFDTLYLFFHSSRFVCFLFSFFSPLSAEAMFELCRMLNWCGQLYFFLLGHVFEPLSCSASSPLHPTLQACDFKQHRLTGRVFFFFFKSTTIHVWDPSNTRK